MRNRAKCKLCNSVIESKNTHDIVTCSCGEISIDGGSDYCHANVKTNLSNLICIDDEGNEIVPKYPAKSEITDMPQNTSSIEYKGGRRELLSQLSYTIHNLQKLPKEVQHSPLSHSDFESALSLIFEIFLAS